MSESPFHPGSSGQPGLDGLVETCEQISVLTQSGAPLAPGLRALAEELGDRRTQRWLLVWAAAVEAGQSLDAALAAIQRSMPEGAYRLLAAASGSGRLAETLEKFLAARRRTAELRSRQWSVLAYPLALMLVAAAVMLILSYTFTRSSIDMITQMNEIGWNSSARLPTPPLLEAMVGLQQYGHFVALGLAALVTIGCGLYWTRGRLVLTWLGAQIPLLGLANWYAALGEAARHLQTLTALNLPLADAIRHCGSAVDHALLERGSRAVAHDVAAGLTLGQALARQPAVPGSVTLLVNWGERHATLPATLGILAAWCDDRARGEQELLRMTLPPLTYLVVAALAMAFVGSIYTPMISLIQMLS